jgi:hypothetical protein
LLDVDQCCKRSATPCKFSGIFLDLDQINRRRESTRVHKTARWGNYAKARTKRAAST